MPVTFPKHLKPIEPQASTVLQQERDKATFNTKDLKQYIYGTEYLQKREHLLKVLTSDPILSDKSHRYYHGREIRFKKALAAAKRMAELSFIHNWTDEDYVHAEFLLDEPNPFRLHRTMFMPTIAGQGTEEQKKLFLEPALKYEIIGCYAQTELGHGSNVRGLETTATYNPETETFILNSPTLTASKWWIGGLGVAANYACVMARLITNGKDYGPHPFIVQIRNLEDHKPLDGVTVGDIGPKFGFNMVDNGFILFDHVHIPHVAMLARFSQVDKRTGEYITPPNSKLAYGTMVFVRANIVLESRLVLARAATVAIRYSAVRAQGSDAANPKKITAADGSSKIVETPVLDYSMQQYRLFPIIAQAFACHFTGKMMIDMYYENQAKMEQGDFSYLADLHASSSGLKSLTTTLALSSIEECRRSCGGHGYSLFSGLGHYYQDYLPKVTWEGDNYLLTQQTVRYLLKTFRSACAGKISAKNANFTSDYISEYLANPQARSPFTSAKDLRNPEAILSAFKHRVAFLIEKAVHAIDVEQVTWNDMLVEVYRISRAHCQLVLVSNFLKAVFNNKESAEPKVNDVLQRLAILFSLHTLEQESADLLMSGYLSAEQAMMIKSNMLSIIKSIRPDVVALVDALDVPDYLLNSALGESKGHVYEKMTAMAELEPLNQTNVVDGYEEYLRPFFHKGKQNWKYDSDGVARLVIPANDSQKRSARL